jgi:hypothetical protein
MMVARRNSEAEPMTDLNVTNLLFQDCDIIMCGGNAKPEDKHLAWTVHCVDEEIVGWLKRREQRRPRRPALFDKCLRCPF